MVTRREKKSQNTAQQYFYSSIRGFLKRNKINTQYISQARVIPSKVQLSDQSVSLFKITEDNINGEIMMSKELDRELIINFLDCLPSFRDKVISLCLKDLGWDTGDLLDLKIEDILQTPQDQKRIFVQIIRNKTAENARGFFSVETTKFVRKFLKLYRKNAKPEEPLFVLQEKEFKIVFARNQKRSWNPEIDPIPVMPLTSHGVADIFRNAAKRFEKRFDRTFLKEKEQSPLRPKRWRKTFTDAADLAGIPENILDIFLGKKTNSRNTYRSRDRINLEGYFVRIEKHIWIYEDPNPKNEPSPEIVEKMDEMQNEIDLLKKERSQNQKKWKSKRKESLPEDATELVKKLTPEKRKQLAEILAMLEE